MNTDPNFTTEGNSLTEADIRRLHLADKPFTIVSFPVCMDENLPFISKENRFIIIWFNNAVFPKFFELPKEVIFRVANEKDSHERKWRFKLNESKRYTIEPY